MKSDWSIDPQPSQALVTEIKLLKAYAKDLERRLAETQGNLNALAAAQIDAALKSPNTMPLLLHEAQAVLRRSHTELEQKVAERTAELRASEERYRLASQAVNGVLYDWDLRTGEIVRSPGMELLTGYHPDEVPGDPTWWRSLVEPKDRIAISPILDAALQSDADSFQFEYRVRHRDERWVYVSDQATILRDHQGKPIRLVGTVTDITPQKQIMEALRVSDERFRVALNHVGITVFSQDRDLRYTWTYNPVASSEEEDLIGKTDADFYSAEDAGKLTALKRQVLETGTQIRQEVHVTIQNGTRDFDAIIEPLRDSAGEIVGVLGSALDITRWRQAEAALRESEGRFRAMADGTPVMIWVHDAAGRMEFTNRAWTDFFGKTLEQVREDGWQPLVHPEDARAYIDEFVQCTRERRPFHTEVRAWHKSGEWRWVESRGQPRFSETGEFLGMAGSSLDITTRKRAEEIARQYAARLEQSNRDLEEFAFVASHDLQEPLLKLSHFGRTIKDRYSERLDDDGRKYLERMLGAAERMQRMIDDLLRYSRVTTSGQSFQQVSLEQAAQEALDALEARVVRANGQVEVDSLPVIDADPAQMRQLFQNLIGNALKFHRPGTPPVIKIGRKESGPDRVLLFVEDNGIGFDMQYREQIFQPFKRLHGRSEYEGSGIGLALCRKIVERHGGAITAESSPGAGATFRVTLPVHQTDPKRS